MTPFFVVAALMTLAAVLVVVLPLMRSAEMRAPIAALAAAMAIPVGVFVLFGLASNYPWGSPEAQANAATQLADAAKINELKQRTAEQPGDVEAWAALGDAYMAIEHFSDAREAYRRAILASNGGDDALRLGFAEASILDNPDALQEDAAGIFEDVLSRDPFNAKALWYGGMAALARGDAEVLRQHWGKLLDLSPPQRVREIIEQQLASLGAGTGAPGGREGTTTRPAAAVRIPVRISIDPALVGRMKPGAVLFLIAREHSGAGGPPLAVVRRQPVQLPLNLEIGDADSMTPGGSLAGHGALLLTARLAATGEAKAAPGDLFGEARWQAVDASGGPLLINIDQIVP